MKLGWGKDPMQRASDGWWESSHPTIEKYGERWLCGKLAPPHCELIGLWECKDEAEEKALHEQFNEGVLKRADCHNEFYEEVEWPKIKENGECCSTLGSVVQEKRRTDPRDGGSHPEFGARGTRLEEAS